MNQDDLANIAAHTKQTDSSYDHIVKVCVAAGCLSANADQVKTQLESEVKQRGLESCCKVKGRGLHGTVRRRPAGCRPTATRRCSRGDPGRRRRHHRQRSGRPARLRHAGTGQPLDFFVKQKKVVLENCGEIDPEQIEDYIAAEGYEALFHCITRLKPLGVIEQITRSGLRGRGGAGFPTGLKWTTVDKAGGNRKYRHLQRR